MPYPTPQSEHDSLIAFVDDQLSAIRCAAHGLSEEQARATPCRSELSIGGLLKHTVYVMESLRQRHVDPSAPMDEAGFALFTGSFALTSEETLTGMVAAFDAARVRYLELIGGIDPAAESVEAPAPWDGIFEPLPTFGRYQLLHQLEELARHAGHADVIREQLDGASGPSLAMAAAGLPGNDFVRPWQP